MSVYLDASVLVGLIDPDSNSTAAELFVETCGQVIVVSDFAVLEVASALGLKVRTNRYADETVLRSEDVACSESALARFDLTLRAADALHIAAACRLGAMLVTFDRRQAASATSLGVSVARL